MSSRAVYGSIDPKTLDGSSIKSLVLDKMKTWHPVLRQLVADSDSTLVAAVTVLRSTPAPAWEPSNVTLVGDAIHTMTPLQGLGGSTALRNAGLCRRLIEVDRGSSTPLEAIGHYERAMRDYSFRAAERSAQFGKLAISDNWLLRTGFKTALRVTTRIPALKRHIFNSANWS